MYTFLVDELKRNKREKRTTSVMDTKRLSIIGLLALILTSAAFLSMRSNGDSKKPTSNNQPSHYDVLQPEPQPQPQPQPEPEVPQLPEPSKQPEEPEQPQIPQYIHQELQPEPEEEDPIIKKPEEQEEQEKQPDEPKKPTEQDEPLIPQPQPERPHTEEDIPTIPQPQPQQPSQQEEQQQQQQQPEEQEQEDQTQITPGQELGPSKKILVSIVVPVYNTEKYIRTALDSLIGQTLKEIEIIVVDGTDVDNSTNIIKEYMKRDPRVRIIFNVGNVGPGPSRNLGIEAARGEYVGFLDSDDYVNKEYYEILYKAATADKSNIYDIAKGNCLMEENGRITYKGTSTGTVTAGSRKINEYFTYQHFTGMFSTKLLREHPNARYGDMLVGEDLVFLNSACYYARNLVFKENAEYHYVQRKGSISNTESPRKFVDVPRFYRAMIEFLKSTRDNDMIKRRAGTLKGIVDRELRDNKKYENSSEERLKNAYEDLRAIRQELNSL